MNTHKKALIWVAKSNAFIIGFFAGAFGSVLAVAYFVGRNEPRLMGHAIWIGGLILGIILARLTGRLLNGRNKSDQTGENQDDLESKGRQGDVTKISEADSFDLAVA